MTHPNTENWPSSKDSPPSPDCRREGRGGEGEGVGGWEGGWRGVSGPHIPLVVEVEEELGGAGGGLGGLPMGHGHRAKD